jgi:hypothetical protein
MAPNRVCNTPNMQRVTVEVSSKFGCMFSIAQKLVQLLCNFLCSEIMKRGFSVFSPVLLHNSHKRRFSGVEGGVLKNGQADSCPKKNPGVNSLKSVQRMTKMVLKNPLKSIVLMTIL